MTYKIIEMQTNNGTTAHIVTDAATRNEAEAEWHRVLAAAAVSNVQTHSCVILSEEGVLVMSGCYKHDQGATAE